MLCWAKILKKDSAIAQNPVNLDRRPIQSRNTRWAERVTNWLVAWRVTPNFISIAGMFAAIVAGIMFWQTSLTATMLQRGLWLCGALLCQLRLLANLFDGMVAIKRQIASKKGELYNEVPDRVSDAAILIGLGYAVGGVPALGYLAALLAVFVAYVRAVGKAAGAPQDYCGPMAKPQRMALITITAVYLALSPTPWQYPYYVVNGLLAVIIVGCLFTAIRRLRSAAHYLELSQQ